MKGKQGHENHSSPLDRASGILLAFIGLAVCLSLGSFLRFNFCLHILIDDIGVMWRQGRWENGMHFDKAIGWCSIRLKNHDRAPIFLAQFYCPASGPTMGPGFETILIGNLAWWQNDLGSNVGFEVNTFPN